MEAARISIVICQLCKATVRANSLTKLQLHLETRHDVLHNQDLVMALSFLEVQEMEVIIDQVIPRMKSMLDEGQSPSNGHPEEKLETVTETLVEACAMFIAFREQLGLPEDRDTREGLRFIHSDLGTTFAS